MSTQTETTPEHLPEVFPPTLREVMLRPRWLAMLGFCLIVAAVFAWLGQWQLGRALDTAPQNPGITEHMKPIDAVVKPGAYLDGELVGQKTMVRGHFMPGDFIVISQRVNDGVEGYWVTGQLRLSDTATPTSLAVGIGWAPTEQKADAAVVRLNAGDLRTQTLTGRLISDEGPVAPPHDQPLALTSMSPAALLSRWHNVTGVDVYRPYLVSFAPAGGLVAISAPAPKVEGGVNWLNLFYAVEWAVFAGFAFYLWYRLARDACERETEELNDAAAAASGDGPPPDASGSA